MIIQSVLIPLLLIPIPYIPYLHIAALDKETSMPCSGNAGLAIIECLIPHYLPSFIEPKHRSQYRSCGLFENGHPSIHPSNHRSSRCCCRQLAIHLSYEARYACYW